MRSFGLRDVLGPIMVGPSCLVLVFLQKLCSKELLNYLASN